MSRISMQKKERTNNYEDFLVVSFFKNLFLNNRFFYGMFGCIVLFVFSFIYSSLFIVAKLTLTAFLVAVIIDMLILFLGKNNIVAWRVLPEKLSNGDDNEIKITLRNNYGIEVFCTIIDELPFQFQIRDFSINKNIVSGEEKTFSYKIRPTERGEYHFGDTLIYVKTKLGLVAKRYRIKPQQTMVKTYPSFIQLKKYDFISFNSSNLQMGLKKIRRIGNSFEFEQIKDYVQGDNIKDINWKATAKRNQLMVNQHQDEKSQQIYSIIDTGRVMKMPFKELSLLDYAINASLVISSVVLRKHDKAGLLSFSKKTENYVRAERRNSQMNLILESLYNVNTDFAESDFGNLYALIKRKVTQRSLLMLYTNFESIDAVHRQMKYLRAINKSHLLIIVFFENTELDSLRRIKAINTQDIFDKTIACLLYTSPSPRD